MKNVDEQNNEAVLGRDDGDRDSDWPKNREVVVASFKGRQIGGGWRRASRSVCPGVVKNTVLTDWKKGGFSKQQACGYGDTERLCTSRIGMAWRGSSRTVDEVGDFG
jgi:hypothetical protein